MEFKLQKPLQLANGNEVSILNLDYDVLTFGDLKTANKIAKMVSESSPGEIDNAAVTKRLDHNIQLGIAWCAAIKGTQGLKVNDVVQLSMVDALLLAEDAMTNYLFR